MWHQWSPQPDPLSCQWWTLLSYLFVLFWEFLKNGDVRTTDDTCENNYHYKAGVINDPLGQPTVPAGSDCRVILKFCDGRTDGLTDTLCENMKIVITTGRDCGRPRGSTSHDSGSAEWINWGAATNVRQNMRILYARRWVGFVVVN